jgi:hypothetical protein
MSTTRWALAAINATDRAAFAIGDALEPLGRYVELFGNATGLVWGITPVDRFWHRRGGMHIFELLVMAPLIYALWSLWGVACWRRCVSEARQTSKPRFAADTFFGAVLLVAWILQVIFKAARENPLVQLCWLAVPCHVMTLCWAFVLLSPPAARNYPLCRYLASLLSLSSWGAFAAAAFPDMDDHLFSIEAPAFFIHHFVLLLMPHYFAAKHGLLRLTWDLLAAYLATAFAINFFVYTPFALFSGVNVNYNLGPHPAMARRWALCNSQWYRFFVPVVLAAWSVGYWFLIVGVNALYMRFVVGCSEVISPIMSRNTSTSPPPSRGPASDAEDGALAAGAGRESPRKRTASGAKRKAAKAA